MGIVPIETLIVPVLFALPPGSDRLLVMRVRPIPVTARAAGRFSSSDPGRWIPMLLAEEVPTIMAASDVVVLLVLFFFISLGFLGVGRVLFGTTTKTFSSSSLTSTEFVRFFVGGQDFDVFTQQNPIAGSLFYFAFLAF